MSANAASTGNPRCEVPGHPCKLASRWTRPSAMRGQAKLADVAPISRELTLEGADPGRCNEESAGDRPASRILVVDDNAGILDDFRKILAEETEPPDVVDGLEAALFNHDRSSEKRRPRFDVDVTLDGQAACARARTARAEKRPYAVAFVDMRMPGGWDGLTTIEELWRADPEIEIVICTAYSDFGWDEITDRLGSSDQFLILRKPFEMIEVQQLAVALSQKWHLRRAAHRRLMTLEQEVEERTRDLRETLSKLEVSNRKLSTALDSAAAASQAKSEFLAAMSHELRTPLNAVIGFSEILATQMFGALGHPRYRDYAQIIVDSGNHLLGLINDVLDSSKLDAGHLELQDEVVDLVQVASQCVRMMGPQADKAGVTLNVEIEEGLLQLRADERRVRQVLLNLLSNAVKFTQEGGRVRLSARCQDGSISVRVVDTGIGMAPEDIPRALERFGQIDTGLNRRYNGTGLGLPLSKALVECHGGSLTIESGIGVGTAVTVIFPAERSIDGSPVA